MEIYWDRRLKNKFEELLTNNEEILWAAKPMKWPYFAGGSLQLLFSLFGVVFFIAFYTILEFESLKKHVDYFFYVIPTIFSVQIIFNIIKKIYFFQNTVYACTNKRILIKEGWMGNKLISIDFNKISDVIVKESFIDKKYDTGSIKFHSGKIENNDNGATKIYDQWLGIENVYEVYKIVKEKADEAPPEQKTVTKIVYRDKRRRPIKK